MGIQFPAATERHESQSMDEIEARMGLEPLDALQEQRATMVEELAALRAFATSFDGKRRAVRAVILLEIRDRLKEKGEKVPGHELLTDEACADSRYQTWLENAEEKLARKETLEFRVLEISETIQRGQMAGRFVTAERFGG